MKLKFWEKKAPKKPKGFFQEWGDAILFAVIAATLIRWATFEAYTIPTPSMEKSLLVGDFLFVSKLHYGPRTPITPLQVPLTHQTIWGTTIPSYSDAIKLPSYRLPGFSEVKNNDVVVFNYPPEEQHPTDLRTNYIKRCMGIAGDSIEVRDMQVFINGKPAENPEEMQYRYYLLTDQAVNERVFRDLDITDVAMVQGGYLVWTKPTTIPKLQQLGFIKDIILTKDPAGQGDPEIFPHSSKYKWNKDYFGPLYIPKKGATVAINPTTLPLYETAILKYEGNENARVQDSTLYINDQPVTNYTFKQDYFFMMGDNRHNSADSRFWGFVPHDHVVGKAVMIWMSRDPYESVGIRWRRIFNIIE
ncbi:MAG: signal peptidase I [Chitinophagaceae bacterium]|nr:MAG: signal peptidase I [Chitinophagaceae bacterium]